MKDIKKLSDEQLDKEIEKAYNDNSKIPFMLSKDIFSYGYKLGYSSSKSQIDNLTGQVKFYRKSNDELRKDIDNDEFRKKVSEKNIEYKIYSKLIYKLQAAIENRDGNKITALYDEIRQKLELLNLELNKK